MEYRRIDFFIGFLICIVLSTIFGELDFNFKNVVIVIIGSCMFGMVFGFVTNYIFKKRH